MSLLLLSAEPACVCDIGKLLSEAVFMHKSDWDYKKRLYCGSLLFLDAFLFCRLSFVTRAVTLVEIVLLCQYDSPWQVTKKLE